MIKFCFANLLLLVCLPRWALAMRAVHAAKNLLRNVPGSAQASPRTNAVVQYTDGTAAFYLGILAMQEELKQHSSTADHVVMIPEGTPHITDHLAALKEIGVDQAIVVNTSEIQNLIDDCPNCLKQQFQKLVHFNLTGLGYTRLAHVDCDVMAVRNFDDIFSFSSVSMAHWLPFEYNGGVYVFEPSRTMYQELIGHLRKRVALDNTIFDADVDSKTVLGSAGHQGFLQSFLMERGELHELPYGFNVRSASLREEPSRYASMWAADQVRLVHFTMNKAYKHGNWFLLGGLDQRDEASKYICRWLADAEAGLQRSPGLKAVPHLGETVFGDWTNLIADHRCELLAWVTTNCQAGPRVSAEALSPCQGFLTQAWISLEGILGYIRTAVTFARSWHVGPRIV